MPPEEELELPPEDDELLDELEPPLDELLLDELEPELEELLLPLAGGMVSLEPPPPPQAASSRDVVRASGATNNFIGNSSVTQIQRDLV
jgi:hypothetical protein